MNAHERKYSLIPVSVPRVQTAHRRIVTELPVPESLPVLQELERLEPSSMQGQPPVIIDRSEGWHVHDRWGNTWLDWSSGVLISNLGNSNPAIVDALRDGDPEVRARAARALGGGHAEPRPEPMPMPEPRPFPGPDE